VVAYNLSVACHHCAQPVCGTQCSADAIWKRPDGIVVLDQARCTKCNKCRMDCPYDAIRFDASTNTVGKCDFCADDVEAGRTPACVAACPNRAIDFGDLADLRRRYAGVDRVFPLAEADLCRPSLVIRTHRHADLAQAREPEIANWEEV